MLHAKFQDLGLLVLRKKIYKGFYHIWACQPSWSCDLYHLYKLSFPFPRRLHMKFGIDQAVSEKMFENNGYIHVYSLVIGADNPAEVNNTVFPIQTYR